MYIYMYNTIIYIYIYIILSYIYICKQIVEALDAERLELMKAPA